MKNQRIMLRNFRNDDLSDLFEYSSQVGVGEMAGWKHHVSLTISKKVLANNIRDTNIFAIVYREINKVIGHIAVNPDSENSQENTKELGFVLNQNYQNRGIMQDVIKLVLEHLFSNNIEFVYACCYQDNEPSKKLIEKCGFLFEQTGTHFSQELDQSFPTFEYVFTKSQWEQKM
jgi:Acetyltransferases, including N-acetylases of ribosomal proteins